MRSVQVATDFSKYPAGRFKSDGPFSGEHFRELFLIPAIVSNEAQVEINLDGARGYGSSFLEEAFGGLIRLGYSSDVVLSKFVFVSKRDPSLVNEIIGYIKNAKQ